MSALSIKHISQMLDNPRSVTIDQAGKIKALKDQYPYFTPAQHLEAAVLQNVQPFSASVLNIMHNSNTNWMLLYSYLEQITPLPADYAAPETIAVEQVASQPVAPPTALIELDIEDEGAEEIIIAEEQQTSGIIVEKRAPEAEVKPKDLPPVQPVVSEGDDIMAELRKPVQNTGIHTDVFGENDFVNLNQDFISDSVNDTNIELPEFSEDVVNHGLAVNSEEVNDLDKDVTEPTPLAEEEITSLPLNLFGEEHAPAENFDETFESFETTPVNAPTINTTNETSETEAEPQKEQEEPTVKANDALIQPIYTEDYFLHEGVEISNELPEHDELIHQQQDDGQQSLMVMRSFVEWLSYFKTKSKEQQEEEEDKKALKTRLQKQKLAAAIEEENEEIPEQVFEMAVNSITHEDGLASESLAEIYVKQAKYDKAIDMYRKLSLRNPQKNTYFARKIEEVLKEKQS